MSRCSIGAVLSTLRTILLGVLLATLTSRLAGTSFRIRLRLLLRIALIALLALPGGPLLVPVGLGLRLLGLALIPLALLRVLVALTLSSGLLLGAIRLRLSLLALALLTFAGTALASHVFLTL
jgi:ABC-type glycerol-3-phosphate transport system permease component